MALNPDYFVTSDLDTYFVTAATGLPLANGILTFYRDSARTVLKDIFTLSGAPPYGPDSYVQLPNPLTLSNVGTVQDASGNNVVIYYYPFDMAGNQDLYYVTCTDSGFNPEFTREAWPPEAVTNSTPPVTAPANFTENQLSNPTFTNVFLNPGITNTLTVTSASSQVFPLGPDWDFVISGTGTVVVKQVPIAGVTGVPSSPPYMLDVNVSSGISSCFLRQRFLPNAGLWAAVGSQFIYLTGSFVAQNQNTGTTTVSMYYTTSGTSPTPVLIFSGTVTTIYQFLSGGTSATIPVSSDNNSGNLGYIDIYLSFLANSEVQVSSIQLIPSLTASTSVLAPDLNSSNRNEAYQGDYYIPRNNSKPTGSFLTGWDFTLNPFQFGVSSSTTGSPGTIVSTTAKYIVDQTIAQSSNSATVSWAADAITDGLSFSPVVIGSQSFYILQYLSGSQVQRMLAQKLSVNINGYQTNPSGGNPVQMQIYLFAAPTTIPTPPAIPLLSGTPSTIGSIATNGTFTLSTNAIANGWFAVPRSGLPIPQINLNNIASNLNLINSFTANDYGFNGWQMPVNSSSTANYFAIVITFAYSTASTAFTINSISLVPGDIPCRPIIQTPTEVLLECQYYYQKSFIGSQPPVQNLGVNTGESIGVQAMVSSASGAGPFIRFPVTMRSTSNPSGGGPNTLLYNPAVGGVSAMIRNSSTSTDWTGSTPTGATPQGFATFGTSPAGSATGNFSAVHWTADARLGIV